MQNIQAYSPMGHLGAATVFEDFLGGASGNVSTCNAADLGLIPGVGKTPWRRKWQPASVFLPGEFHGQRSLVSYSPWGHREGHN